QQDFDFRQRHLFEIEQTPQLHVHIELRRGSQNSWQRNAERGVETHERVVALVQLAECALRFVQRRVAKEIENAALLVAEERVDREQRLVEIFIQHGNDRRD